MSTTSNNTSKPTSAPPTQPHPKSRPGLALGLLAAAQLLIVFNGTSANLALPQASADLGLSDALAVWVVSGYLLTFGGLLIVAGRLGDLVGRRRLLLASLVLFGLGASAAGLAPNGAFLVVSRVLQGVGAAGVGPGVLALIAATFPDPDARRRALGVWGAAASAGGALGVLGGGALTTWFDWRAVLLVNAPVVVVLLIGIPATVASVPANRGTRVNPVGALLSVLGIAAMIAGVTVGDRLGWTSGTVLGLFATGLVLIALFAATERFSTNPLIARELLRRSGTSSALIAILAAAFAMYPVMFLASVLLQTALGYSPVAAGLMMLPISAATVVGAMAAPRLIPRTGPIPPLLLGLVLVAGGTAAFAITAATGTHLAAFVPATAVFGAGMGLTITSGMTLGLAGATPAEAGAISGILQTGQQLGGAIGLAAISTISTSVATSSSNNTGFGVGLGVASALVALGLIVVSVRRAGDPRVEVAAS